jgi:3-oxoacyl-[acyl-carrier-protein] synthase-3
MYYGGLKNGDNSVIPWRNLDPKQWTEESVFALKQDSRLLEKQVTKLGGSFLKDLLKKYGFDIASIDHFLPHMSSEFFRDKIRSSLMDFKIDIPIEKWFTNLHNIGNIGAASGFLMLEELYNTGVLKKGEKLLLMIPESARFSYTFVHLTVV